MRPLLLGLSLAVSVPAHALCGTFVGAADDALANHRSTVVVALDGEWTTLTMVNDVQGDAAGFGLVLPVPAGLDPDDVRLIDGARLDRLDRYTAPRLVRQTCSGELTPVPAQGGGASLGMRRATGCGGPSRVDDPNGAGEHDTDHGVWVEDRFDLGPYTAWKLSAEGGEGLYGWLDAQGFVLPEAAVDVFDGYVEQGSHFLALRIAAEVTPGEVIDLPPLQLAYTGGGRALPLRAGTASSAGVQDLALHVLSRREDGRIGIANLPEVGVPTDCLVPEGEDPRTWYADVFAEASGLSGTPDLARAREESGAVWATNYSWDVDLGSVKCDPCPPDLPGLPLDDVVALGLHRPQDGYHVTRLHLRYTPDALTQDVVLYGTGDRTNAQVRLFEHAWELESLYPMCDGTLVDDPGSCFSAAYWHRRAAEGDVDPDLDTSPLLGPACTPARSASAAVLLLLPLAAWGRRRRW